MQTYKRPVKWIVLLSNHVDRRDDDSFYIWAKSYKEAEVKTKTKGWDTSRFSLRGIYRVTDLK